LKFVLKLIASASVALILGAVSADFALWVAAQHGAVSATSDNPYARAAYVIRDFFPGDAPAETQP
jgi:hypothetical protein